MMAVVPAMSPSRLFNTIVDGRYRLDRLVGQGSFAWVYHAFMRSGQEVAVKVLYSDEPTAGVRFAREVEVLRALPPSPSLVRYIDHGHTIDGWPYLALEFVDGITLKDGMVRRPILEPAKAAAFMAELCAAFVGLHQLGVAHRDVKPENILLARQGGIKLIDFGLLRDAQGILKLLEEQDPLDRRLFAEELDQRILVGTPEYMAPEQFSDASMEDMAEGRTDTWSDVYSLGVILFQLLTGQKLFPMREALEDAEYAREMLRYMRWRLSFSDGHLPPCPGIDPALDSILRKALRQEPRQRQPDARVLRDDLARYLSTGQGVTQTDESRTQMVSLNQLMQLQAGRRSPGPAPGTPRALPPIADDEDETAARPSLVDEEVQLEGHTVMFFSPLGPEASAPPPGPACADVSEAAESKAPTLGPPPLPDETATGAEPFGQFPAEGVSVDVSMDVDGLMEPLPGGPPAGFSDDGNVDFQIEGGAVDDREEAWSDETEWEQQSPWAELTPTNPHGSTSPYASAPLVPGGLDLLAPGLGETSTTLEETDDEVTNRLVLAEVVGGEEASLITATETEAVVAAEPAAGSDLVTRKVNIAEVMSEELARHRKRRL
jgi:serine/threonine protein kinase